MKIKNVENTVCPNCDSESHLIQEKTVKEYRGEEFEIYEFHFQCENCAFEFTTNHIDELTIDQVYNAYREKYGIPFPEELISLRKKHDISQREMSKLLSFGQNIWANYENGEVPSKANSEYIHLLFNDHSFKELFNRKRNDLNQSSLKKITNSLFVEEQTEYVWTHLDWLGSPNKYNGYKSPSFEKFAALVNYIVAKENGNEYRTKLNKIIKYCDFTFFKRYGKSITGCKYSVLPYGVCPSNHDSYYSIMIESGQIENQWISINGADIPKLIARSTQLDDALFNASEMAVIKEVVNSLTKMTRDEVVNLDHEEDEWSETKVGDQVDYRSTFNLKAF